MYCCIRLNDKTHILCGATQREQEMEDCWPIIQKKVLWFSLHRNKLHNSTVTIIISFNLICRQFLSSGTIPDKLQWLEWGKVSERGICGGIRWHAQQGSTAPSDMFIQFHKCHRVIYNELSILKSFDHT